jgi:hypothetical protein
VTWELSTGASKLRFRTVENKMAEFDDCLVRDVMSQRDVVAEYP